MISSIRNCKVFTPSVILTVGILFAGLSYCEASLCYWCQYNSGQTGYECVTSPAEYIGGPSTMECNETGCQSYVQSNDGFNSIWFIHRGCKTQEDSSDGSILVETCTDTELCNNKSYAPSTAPTSSTPSTTRYTAPPGSRSCYSCVYSYSDGADDSCLTSPSNVPSPNTVSCPPSSYCTIFRQWDRAEFVVRSFSRGCVENQNQRNGCVTDIYFVTCNTYCSGELCNTGDGANPPINSAVSLHSHLLGAFVFKTFLIYSLIT